LFKKVSNTIGISVIIIIFTILIYIGYNFLKSQMEENHIKDSKIFFYEISNQTNMLLRNLWYQYDNMKLELIDIHKEVEKYLLSHSYEGSLYEIYEEINRDYAPEKPYDIYITDSNFTIVNSTFKPDVGFNISFSKKSFDRHKRDGVIEPCFPLFEKASKSFKSYTDSYLPKESGKRILQVSFSYPKTTKKLKELADILNHDKSIASFRVYLFLDSGFINDIILNDYTSYKPTLKEILARIKEGREIDKKISGKKLVIEHRSIGDKEYKMMYLKVYSSISVNTYMIYSVMFDESSYLKRQKELDIVMMIMTFIGLIAIIVIYRIWNREKLLEAQDKFVKSAMHEIGTPLNVIILNNELREEVYGKDIYTTEIDTALKVLKNSYDDISYLVRKENINYHIELIDIAYILNQRVEYFKSIAKANRRELKCFINSSCKSMISLVELIRVIDNNLSNAIKYSNRDTTITVLFQDNIMSFHSIGDTIEDNKRVFDKYVRENRVLGGYGLGLNIVKSIANKYNIEISLDSSLERGTTFSYRFKCHTNDIS